MLYQNILEDFIKHLEITDKSEQTITGYKKELNYFNNFLVNKYNCPIYLSDISLEDIEDYLQYKKINNHAACSRNRALYILRSFYKYSIKRNLCKSNLANLIEPVKVKQKERNFLTEEEFQRLITAIDKPVIKTLVQTMYYTGGRISEIINLKIKDVDLENKIIYIIDGKGGKDRKIPINNKLLKILKNYKNNIRVVDKYSNNFFANKRSGLVSSSYVNKIIKEASITSNINKKISAHTLRHSFGTNLLNKGASLVSIQKLLGHSNLSVTSIYLHQDINTLDNTINLL